MSTPFIHDNFLLESAEAERLFHEYAKQQPIIDYHCHLPPDQIAANRNYDNISQIWLAGDHYKWRAMRTNGVDERFCTGDATDREKFDAWAATVPKCLRNPLYHWTHLELNDPFDYHELLSPSTADAVWNLTKEKLAQPAFTPQGLMKHFQVEVVCTTDDPIDSLEHHRAIAADAGCSTKVLPTWRPDKVCLVGDTKSFNEYVDQLEEVSGEDCATFDGVLAALQKRHDYFAAHGCRLSDHGLEKVDGVDYSLEHVRALYGQLRAGMAATPEQRAQYQHAILHELALMDHAKGWTQQFHLGAMRNNNPRLFRSLGADTGFDSIGDYALGTGLSRFFGKLDDKNTLAKTILYNLNPRDNELMATMIGNFQDGSVPGKMQYGSGWWFLDQWDGMTKQMEALSNLGLLSRFVGMLTDSRSFLSYSRHEYFRRLLCHLLGKDMARGFIPHDYELVGQMVSDICYNNAKGYFGFDTATVDAAAAASAG